MKTLSAWNNSIKRSEKAREKENQRRRDNRALKNAGVKKYKSTQPIPQWFKNINKTFKLTSTSTGGRWNEWCNKQLDHLGIDPRKKKRPAGRPKLPTRLKKESTKIKRSDQMKALLLKNGIHLTDAKPYADIFLIEYPEWQFMVNGRLKHSGGAIISVHKFLTNIAVT